MTNHDPRPSSAPFPSGPGTQAVPGSAGEYERLSHTVSLRFAPHVHAAAAAVRTAEQELADAREQLERAQAVAAARPYKSDPLVFMRASAQDEVEALGRKTTPRKAKAAFGHLLDRATELAEGEVKGFLADQAAAERDRHEGVEARLESERRARATLEAALEMQDRVRTAEQLAMQGLVIMSQKLAAEGSAQ
jgi:hypothetical protein